MQKKQLQTIFWLGSYTIILIGCNPSIVTERQDLLITITDRDSGSVIFTRTETYPLPGPPSISSEGLLPQEGDEEQPNEGSVLEKPKIPEGIQKVQERAQFCGYTTALLQDSDLYSIRANLVSASQGQLVTALECLEGFSEHLVFAPLDFSEGFWRDTYTLKIEIMDYNPQNIASSLDFNRIRIVLPGKMQDLKIQPQGAGAFINIVRLSMMESDNTILFDSKRAELNILYVYSILEQENIINQFLKNTPNPTDEEREEINATLQSIDALKQATMEDTGKSFEDITKAYSEYTNFISANGAPSINLIVTSKTIKWDRIIWAIGLIFGSGLIFQIIKILVGSSSTSNADK